MPFGTFVWGLWVIWGGWGKAPTQHTHYPQITH